MLPQTQFVKLPAEARHATGSVTFPRGFRAAGVAAGIKRSSRLDVGLLVSDAPCISAALFTQNAAAAAPVHITRESGRTHALRGCVVNSGNANAYTGEQGLADARHMRALAAELLQLDEREIAVASTGVIGEQLPMAKIDHGIRAAAAELSAGGGLRFSSAIRTTDRHPKRGAIAVDVPGGEVRLGFAAKGAGMICPNMATMLCFITCDAVLEAQQWQDLVGAAVRESFNRITVDGQESTNDMVLALANGVSGVRLDAEGSRRVGEALRAALECLAIAVVADGEGASTVVRLLVTGAADDEEAEAVARAIADSPLVKTAFYGDDPNWGRIAQAAGQALARGQRLPTASARPPLIHPLRLDIAYGDLPVVTGENPRSLDDEERSGLHRYLEQPEVDVSVHLYRGSASTHVYFSDLTHQYVTLNAEYST